MSRSKKNGTYLNLCIDSEYIQTTDCIFRSCRAVKNGCIRMVLNEYIEKYDGDRSILEQVQKENGEVIDNGE